MLMGKKTFGFLAVAQSMDRVTSVHQDGIDNSPERAYGMHFIACKNITVENLSLKNSSFWMHRYNTCDGAQLRGLRIWNHANKNNDGIDIDSSRNVLITDCQIDASDDAIVVKSEGTAICANIVIITAWSRPMPPASS